jgi:hypothetical protein
MVLGINMKRKIIEKIKEILSLVIITYRPDSTKEPSGHKIPQF